MSKLKPITVMERLRQKPETISLGEEMMRDTLRDLFTEAVAGFQVPERLDYAAARFYVTADDPEITPDQDRRIRRLMQKIKQYISVPLVTSYEEQDPYYGRIVISTLAYEEYGEWKIVNHTDPRISNPPATLPPRALTIHLCWGAGHAGVAQLSEPVNKSKTRVSSASTLQAVAALLLDDWRNALRLLPVRFVIHRARPNPMKFEMKKGGRRWRNRNEGTLPPESVVGLFFERSDHVAVSMADGWQVGESYDGDRSWWCGCLLQCDLEEFGFVRTQASAQSVSLQEPVWKSQQTSLPRELSHLIVIDDVAGKGSFFRVKRNSGLHGETSLVRTYHLGQMPKGRGASFLSLREAALNLVLDELWSRMM